MPSAAVLRKIKFSKKVWRVGVAFLMVGRGCPCVCGPSGEGGEDTGAVWEGVPGSLQEGALYCKCLILK